MAASITLPTSCSAWYQIVTSYYPDSLSRTYSVPPVHFNRVPYVRAKVPGTSLTSLVLPEPTALGVSAPVRSVAAASQSSLLHPPRSLWSQEPQAASDPVRVQESDFRDDASQAHVMRNLQTLGDSRSEVMFVLSQFRFGDYVSKPAYAAAAARLPLPAQLDTRAIKYSDGECDILIIHRRYGLLVGELKSVGSNHDELKLTQDQSDAAVEKRVMKSVDQLNKSKKVLSYIVGDVAPGLTIRTTIFLPYVSAAQLQRVLDNNPTLGQDACSSLGASNTTQAVKLCCCKDQLLDPKTGEVTDADLSRLTSWWEDRMDQEDTQLCDELYLDIVARFVGPASSINVHCNTSPRVEVRTEGEAVAELGWRLAQLVLTPVQVDLLYRSPPLVFLVGPPGTGKTVMLVLQGLSWVCQGIDTYVVSTNYSSIAVSTMITEQLRLTATANPASPNPVGRVLSRHYNFMFDSAALATAVSELTAAAQSGARIILDEAIFITRSEYGKRIIQLVDQLIAQVPGLHLWCADVSRGLTPPSALQTEVLTTPLRCAPAVLREVQPALSRNLAAFHNYSNSGIPAPGDGQDVRHLLHEGSSHTGQWPSSCVQCGKNVAEVLGQLGVNVPGKGIAYRDVFILSRSNELRDEVKNNAGAVTSPACGFVRGIRDEKMPVCVFGEGDWQQDRQGWERKAMDVAIGATDHITVTDWAVVAGLERKVVIWLPSRSQSTDFQLSDQVVDLDRLNLVTRCTTQLVVVDVPPVTPQAAGSQNTNNNGKDNSKKSGAGGGSKGKKGNSDNTGVSWAKKGFLL